MKPITLNELPHYSPWPARLLGLAPWIVPVRNLTKVDAEYDKDKYQSYLAFYREHKTTEVTPEHVKQFEFGDAGEMCVSLGEELVLFSRGEARERYLNLLRDTMAEAIAGADTIVELGCGYGFNLWMLAQYFPGKKYLGGKYSNNAIELAARLYASGTQSSQITVENFNFYDPKYHLLNRADGRHIAVFTAHAIEQLPSAANVIEAIESCGRRLTVFNFEPVFELYSNSLLGLLRRKYAVANDYNRDLYTLLQAHNRLRVIQVVPDVYGANPLNPTSVIRWETAA
jgi:hypothetical protein